MYTTKVIMHTEKSSNINIEGVLVPIHDIESITVDSKGVITSVTVGNGVPTVSPPSIRRTCAFSDSCSHDDRTCTGEDCDSYTVETGED